MTLGSGIGSMPGSDAQAYTESTRRVLGELGVEHGLPHLPELPGRGATASMTGRGVAVLAELGADLQPAGWRLTDAAGVDQRRARSLLAQDLDCVEELGQSYTGPFKVQVIGPWTLAATLEKPRGDKVLSDHGARRELAQALAEGVRDHLADVRRRLPGVDRLVLQVDEPALPAVMNGAVPTASGFGKHRSIDRPEVSEALAHVFGAVADAGAEPWLHSCADDVDWALVRGAGARGLALDATTLSPASLDTVAEALEAGESLALGLLPSTDPADPPVATQVVERAHRWLDMLGLDPAELGDRLVLTPSCGLAGAGPAWARTALRLAVESARQV